MQLQFALLAAVLATSGQPTEARGKKRITSIHEVGAIDITGEHFSFAALKGKVILLVNVASY